MADPTPAERPGDRVLVFDYRAWQEHHDVGDNSAFYRPAEIVREYDNGGERVADVRWLGTNEISRAHFVDGIRKLE